MAILLYDTLDTPAGRSEIVKVSTKKVNQFRYWLIFQFANGLTGKVYRDNWLSPWDESNIIFDD